MENKKNLTKTSAFLLQGLAIIGFFVLAIASTGAEKQMLQGGAQGYVQGSNGRRIIGSARSQRDCYRMAQRAGCSGSYVYYANTKNCFCN